MAEPNVSFTTRTDAIRVFVGYPNSTLEEGRFLEQLGQTFMPGTPYMLQPLGLAAYLPAALRQPAAGLPHEYALICYTSQAAWDEVMHRTLRGRVYNQTHGGVYALPPSAAAFPIHVGQMPPTGVGPYFLFDAEIDWQAGSTCSLAGLKKDAAQDGLSFRRSIRETLDSVREPLAAAGVDQLIVMATDMFAIFWLHFAGAEGGSPPESLSALLADPVALAHERIVCAGEPPPLTIDKSQAFNFIFLRDPAHFLR